MNGPLSSLATSRFAADQGNGKDSDIAELPAGTGTNGRRRRHSTVPRGFQSGFRILKKSPRKDSLQISLFSARDARISSPKTRLLAANARKWRRFHERWKWRNQSP
jgi:hypothetical protein